MQSKSHDEKKPLPGHSISEGTCIGQYRILSGVVSGDQCEIYTAVETALGREVALYFPDEAIAGRSADAARILSRIDNPSLCRIFSVSEFEGRSFIALECDRGTALSQLIRDGALSEKRVLSLAGQLISALRVLHDAGLSYAGLNLDSLLVTDDGRLRLCDYNCYELRTAGPGDSDLRIGILATGLIMYQLLSGDCFSTTSSESAINRVRQAPLTRVRPDLSDQVLTIVNRALEQQERYEHITDVIDDLKRLQGQPGEASESEVTIPVGGNAPLATLTVDKSGTCLAMNATAAECLGGLPEDFVDRKLQDLIPMQVAETQMAYISMALDTGATKRFESEMEYLGQKYSYSISVQPLPDATGRAAAARCVIRGLNRIAQLQEGIDSEHGFVRALLANASSLVVCLDEKARITVFNRECERVTGYFAEEVVGKSWPKMFLPEDHVAHSIKDFGTWVKQRPHDVYEGPLKTKSNGIKTILWSTSMLSSSDTGKVTAITVGQDITERKQTEEALHKSEEQYRQVVKKIDSLIMMIDGAEVCTYINDYGAKTLGRKTADIVGQTMSALFPPAMAESAGRCARTVADTAKELVEECEVTLNGRTRWLQIAYKPIDSSPGASALVLLVVSDITQRKETELALMQTHRDLEDRIVNRTAELTAVKERLDYILMSSPAVIYSCGPGPDFRTIFISNNIVEQLGYYPQEFYDDPFFWTNKIHIEDRPEVLRSLHQVKKGENISYEYRFQHKNGHYVWLIDEVKPLRDAKDDLVGLVGSWLNISKRKAAEDSLRDSEEIHRSLVERASDGICLVQDDIMKFANQRLANILGVPLDQIVGRNVKDFFDADLFAAVTQRYQNYLNGKSTTEMFTTTLMRPDGREVLLEADDTIIRLRDRPATLVFVRDITERTRAEQALRESEERFRLLSQSSEDGVAVVEHEIIVHANETLARMLGYDMADLIGMRISKLTTPQCWKTVARNIKKKYSRPYEIDSVRKDGTLIKAQLIDKTFQWKGKNLHVSVLRDITGIKEVENQLRRTAKELSKERKTLSEKNVALKQILEHIENERQGYKQGICEELKVTISGALRKLKNSSSLTSKEVAAIEMEIDIILARDIDLFQNHLAKLTPRELEICEQIRNGLSSKQISSKLNLALVTVHKHREMIRKKLELTNKAVNLGTYLQSQ